ncbi:hypothetical protein H6P81_016155 [Aristolochia fimbriata]|uniref:Uncharacterized protein n=1 Tax=Aristolochia fimbriata TaxID=158543 RepID=A0AAV7E7F3_ARIFI|nr:hypothetical protein H6P81_016155 [Aristolochia fimbriata]
MAACEARMESQEDILKTLQTQVLLIANAMVQKSLPSTLETKEQATPTSLRVWGDQEVQELEEELVMEDAMDQIVEEPENKSHEELEVSNQDLSQGQELCKRNQIQ